MGITTYLTTSPIDPGKLLSESHQPQSGAVVLFCGDVRELNNHKTVTHIEYESHKSIAEKKLRDIAEYAYYKFKLNRVLVVHRLGKVLPAETAVVVITSSPHRQEAYDASQYIIHTLKHDVPIWKNEWYTDGLHSWGNNCNCPEHEIKLTQAQPGTSLPNF